MDEYDLDLEDLHDDDSFTKPTKPAAPKKNIEVGYARGKFPLIAQSRRVPHMLASIRVSL